jgi:hypothetical protein
LNTRTRSLAFVLLAPLVSIGCAVVASPVGNAAIYTEVKGPIDVGSGASAAKLGRACAANYVGFVAVGDASIEAAKKHGGIATVASVDHESLNVLGVYSRFCTLVAGD